MEIRIKTTYFPLFFSNDDLPNGVDLIKQPAMERRDAFSTSVAIGVLSFVSGVSASIIASWLYDKIKHVKDKPEFMIKVNEKEIREITVDSITETIEKEVMISKR